MSTLPIVPIPIELCFFPLQPLIPPRFPVMHLTLPLLDNFHMFLLSNRRNRNQRSHVRNERAEVNISLLWRATKDECMVPYGGGERGRMLAGENSLASNFSILFLIKYITRNVHIHVRYLITGLDETCGGYCYTSFEDNFDGKVSILLVNS